MNVCRPINTRLLVSSVAVLTVAIVVLTSSIRLGFFDQYDYTLTRNINGLLHQSAVPITILFTELGGSWVWVTLIATLYFLQGSYGKRSAFILASALLCGMVVGILLDQIFYRPRPYMVLSDLKILLLNLPTDSSFPSGHTIRAFSGATALSCRYRRWFLVMFPFAFAVGLSRIYLGLHFPSDVLGGALVGIAVSLCVVLLEGKVFGGRLLTRLE
ncbi:MAG: phosphatase PAP2 family protein [Candidatus Bathyarchaeia archaeon]